MHWSFASWSICCCLPSAVAGIPDVDGVPWFCWRSATVGVPAVVSVPSVVGVPAVVGVLAVALSHIAALTFLLQLKIKCIELSD
jgi:hypothetical protein